MNALTRVALSTRAIAPRALAASTVGSSRMFGLGADLASKVRRINLYYFVPTLFLCLFLYKIWNVSRDLDFIEYFCGWLMSIDGMKDFDSTSSMLTSDFAIVKYNMDDMRNDTLFING